MTRSMIKALRNQILGIPLYRIEWNRDDVRIVKIVSVGDGVNHIRANAIAVCRKYAGVEFEYNGEEYIRLGSDDIWAVFDVAVDFAISLSHMEIEAIREEGGDDQQLLRIRMDTIYANLRIASIIIGQEGYESVKQKDAYRDARASFFGLQRRYGVYYDNDELP